VCNVLALNQSVTTVDAQPSASERISDNLLTIIPRGENKLRTRIIEDKFSVAADCATVQKAIDYSMQL
jgi:hypothetical protein